jgi:surface antigen
MIFMRPFRRTIRFIFAVGAAIALFSLNSGAVAGDLSFLKNSPESKFNADDVRIMNTTAKNLLNGGTVGQSQDWANPNSTAKGTITVVKMFQSAEGFSCKSLRVDNSAGGWQGQATYPVCEVQPGTWKIYTSAKPAAAPK